VCGVARAKANFFGCGFTFGQPIWYAGRVKATLLVDERLRCLAELHEGDDFDFTTVIFTFGPSCHPTGCGKVTPWNGPANALGAKAEMH